MTSLSEDRLADCARLDDGCDEPRLASLRHPRKEEIPDLASDRAAFGYDEAGSGNADRVILSPPEFLWVGAASLELKTVS